MAVAAALVAIAVTLGEVRAEPPGEPFHVYFGTYTRGESTSEGIYRSDFDAVSGLLGEAEPVAKIVDPSFLTIHPFEPFLYAVDREGDDAGGLCAFAIEPGGKLKQIGKTASCGGGPCYVSTDRLGKCALTANYGTGIVAALPIHDDGGLGDAASIYQQRAFRPTDNLVTPTTGNAHAIRVDFRNRFALTTDLKLDQLRVFWLDPRIAKLTANEFVGGSYAHTQCLDLKRGSGPRHLAFHSNGKFLYVNAETSNEVLAFAWDGDGGKLELLETLSTLPADYKGEDYTAEIQIHPSGRFLYVSNRGHDSIAMFAIDPESGRLKALGHEPTQGKTPRHFGIDPTGRWLLAANMNSSSVVVFRIDPDSGKLGPTGRSIRMPSPTCVKYAVRASALLPPGEGGRRPDVGGSKAAR